MSIFDSEGRVIEKLSAQLENQVKYLNISKLTLSAREALCQVH